MLLLSLARAGPVYKLFLCVVLVEMVFLGLSHNQLRQWADVERRQGRTLQQVQEEQERVRADIKASTLQLLQVAAAMQQQSSSKWTELWMELRTLSSIVDQL